MIENKKDFLTTQDFSRDALCKLLYLAMDIKKNKAKYAEALKSKKLGMIFEKSSTRTRVSFEAGIYELGGVGIFLSSRDIQIGRGEPISDTAKVLSRYLDAIMIRTYKQEDVEELAKNASIPVINGLTDLLHPCQAMADFQTILEIKGKLEGIKLCFVGDGNNMANSLGILASQMGMHFSIASPRGYEIKENIVSIIKENAKETGSKINITNNPVEAIEGADVVYTDVWTSMGKEAEALERKKVFSDYQINMSLVKKASSDFIFMHCLPAHRGEEVTDDVIDGSHSVVFDQAENRLHIQKAILYELMK